MNFLKKKKIYQDSNFDLFYFLFFINREFYKIKLIHEKLLLFLFFFSNHQFNFYFIINVFIHFILNIIVTIKIIKEIQLNFLFIIFFIIYHKIPYQNHRKIKNNLYSVPYY